MKKFKVLLASIFAIGITLSTLQGPAIHKAASDIKNAFTSLASKDPYLPWLDKKNQLSTMIYSHTTANQKQKINLLVFNALEGMLMNFASQQFLGPKAPTSDYKGYMSVINRYNSEDTFNGKYSSSKYTSKELLTGGDLSPTHLNWLSSLIFSNSASGITNLSIFQRLAKDMPKSKQYIPESGELSVTYEIVNDVPELKFMGSSKREITVADILGYIVAEFIKEAAAEMLVAHLGGNGLLSLAFYGFIHNGFQNPTVHDRFSDKAVNSFFTNTVLPLGGNYQPGSANLEMYEFDYNIALNPVASDDIRPSSFFFQSILARLNIPTDTENFSQSDNANSNIVTNGVFQFFDYFKVYAASNLNTNHNFSSSEAMYGAIAFTYRNKVRNHKLPEIFSKENVSKFKLNTKNPRGDLYIRSIFTDPDMKLNNGNNIVYDNASWNFKNLFFTIPFNNATWSNKIPEESKIKSSYNNAIKAFGNIFKPISAISNGDKEFSNYLELMDINLKKYWDNVVASSKDWVEKAHKNMWIDDKNYAQISSNIAAFDKERNALFMDNTKVTDLTKSLTALKNDFQILDSKTPKPASNTGVIVGAVIGSIAGVISIAIIVYVVIRKKKGPKNPKINKNDELSAHIKVHSN